MSLRILIKNGRVIDPATKFDKIASILIEGEKIKEIGELKEEDVDKIIDASGKVVLPGLIDMHVHLREPGREDEETIQSGCTAACKGGFTSICCMPNTNPVIDNQTVVEFIKRKAAAASKANVYVIGSITHGLEGKELARIGELVNAGVIALSDDGHPVMDAGLMRRALEYVKIFNIPVISHCEDLNLSRGGVMNEGVISTALGLPGIPSVSEEVMVARDIMLAELTESRIHIAHVSTATSVALLRRAKERGVKVTCETTPHHLILTEESVRGFDTNAKVNPPLRTKTDVEALWDGLKDGTIDVIATDHAPHTQAEKELEFGVAPFGIVGLETAFPLLITELLDRREFDLPFLISKMTINPATILNLDGKGRLASGYDADLVICDLEEERVIDVKEFESLSRNTPFNGWKVKGTPIMTMVKGKVVMERRGGKNG